MAQYSIFDLTLPNGKRSSIGYPVDCVDEYDLKQGELVRVFPSEDSFKVALDIVPIFETGIMCRIMSMNTQVMRAPLWNNVPREVRFLYLASTDVTTQYH